MGNGKSHTGYYTRPLRHVLPPLLPLFLLTYLSFFPGALRTNLPIVQPLPQSSPFTPSRLIDPNTHSVDTYAGQSHIACVMYLLLCRLREKASS
ncbi:uncharacterized protein F4812DRAFT_413642 [Daldinia caldariorum]|uniref:uncharacterized protein n=1 Tax=Daldinia caldariorum TaxID=326644 RepID=UPI002007D7C5|nr:uncharacterized protein F4812DRAFT_413642 [Daldinia caldariorum]KAI1471346.1 hypothetical protein F4812DRAFT_413642 [Daldinia caldariorum]